MKVKFFATIRSIQGAGRLTLRNKDAAVWVVIAAPCSLYGRELCSLLLEDGKLGSKIIVLVNGRNVVHLQGMDTPLEKDDEVSIFPVVAGG